MNEKVTKLAVITRLIVLIIQFSSNLLIPDHVPDVFKSPVNLNETKPLDKVVDFFIGGLKRWDAEYFLHISEYGYTYENTLAFQPLFPGILGVCGKAISILIPQISIQHAALLVATILNVYFFHRAANSLYSLSQVVLGDPIKAWNAVMMFCFNPSSIFFSAPYSESLYCWLTFGIMLECVTKKRLCKIVAVLALCFLCRSNGLTNIGFPLYFILVEVMLSRRVWKVGKIILICVSIVPFILYNSYVYKLFCRDIDVVLPPNIVEYAAKNNFVLAGKRDFTKSPWCDKNIPYAYSYIQDHYWNVGFLRYYELKQLPNFLLAMPLIMLCVYKSSKYITECLNVLREKGLKVVITQEKKLPFVIHVTFMLVFCVAFVYIQVTNRIIASSSPCLYWFAAEYLPKSLEGVELSLPSIKSTRSLIVYWFGIYFVVGTILFSNSYPWT